MFKVWVKFQWNIVKTIKLSAASESNAKEIVEGWYPRAKVGLIEQA